MVGNDFLFIVSGVSQILSQLRGADEIKKLAYLLDLKTIALEDLVFGYALGQVGNFPNFD